MISDLQRGFNHFGISDSGRHCKTMKAIGYWWEQWDWILKYTRLCYTIMRYAWPQGIVLQMVVNWFCCSFSYPFSLFLFFFSSCCRGFCGSAVTTNGSNWSGFEVAAAPRLRFIELCYLLTDIYSFSLPGCINLNWENASLTFWI